MLTFLVKKMIKNKWIVLSLLLGNILLAGVVSGLPMFSQATMQKLLLKHADSYYTDAGVYPGIMEVSTIIRSYDAGERHAFIDYYRDYTFNGIPRSFGIPGLISRETLTVQNVDLLSEIPLSEKPVAQYCFAVCMSDMDRYSQVLLGRMNSDVITADGIIEVVISESAYDELDLLIDNVYVSKNYKYNGSPLRIMITGVVAAREDSGYYWSDAPSDYTDTIFVASQVFEEVFTDGYTGGFLKGTWQVCLDCGKLDAMQTDVYITEIENAKAFTASISPKVTYKEHLSGILTGFGSNSGKLDITLWVLQTPVFIMLAFFIFMASKRILSLDKVDISVLKSRGAGRGQIILIYFLQGMFIAVVSGLAGLPLGELICRLIGASSGFLNLVERTALPVQYNSQAFLFAGIALAVSLITMLLPVIRYSAVTVVDMKRSAASTKKPLWQRLFLDVLAFVVSLYGLYNFNAQRDVIAHADSLGSIDPMMFLNSSLFMLGLGLLCLRLYPLLVRLIFHITKKALPPPAYVSVLRVVRSGGEEQFIMIFLAFTLATGIFSAKTGRTINLNAEDKIRYETGADIRFTEIWRNNSSVDENGSMTVPTVFYEPDLTGLIALPEVEGLAKVYRDSATIAVSGGKVTDASLMAVKTDDFGRVAYNRADLYPVHFFEYLNTLSREPDGVLLSSNMQAYFKQGDTIRYTMENGTLTGRVCGFVDHWPGFVNTTREKGGDGVITDTPNHLIVANLNYIQTVYGLRPYEVWLKTVTGTSTGNFLIRYATENKIRFTSWHDAGAKIIEGKNDPVLQGTNGILTVDFIVILMVCAAGFLIYWILSIRERVLQFGVFRAMGMQVRGVIGILLCEQALVSAVAVLIGTGLGVLASGLFVPMIQLAYSASDQPIPILVVTQTADYVRLFTTIGAVMLLCLAALAVLASKIKIAQALKLGED